MPVGNLVATENGGWPVITSQLTHERVALAAFGGLAYRLWEEVRDWAAGTLEPDGRPRLDELGHQSARGELGPAGRMRLLNEKLASDAGADRLQSGRCLRGQGLRDRMPGRCIPAAGRDPRPGRLAAARLPRRRPAGRCRAGRARDPGQHLCRWRQRDPA